MQAANSHPVLLVGGPQLTRPPPASLRFPCLSRASFICARKLERALKQRSEEGRGGVKSRRMGTIRCWTPLQVDSGPRGTRGRASTEPTGNSRSHGPSQNPSSSMRQAGDLFCFLAGSPGGSVDHVSKLGRCGHQQTPSPSGPVDLQPWTPGAAPSRNVQRKVILGCSPLTILRLPLPSPVAVWSHGGKSPLAASCCP